MIAFLGGLIGGGWGLVKRGFALLGRLNIWQLLCIGLFAAAALFYVQRNNARDDLDTARINLRECRQGRLDDRKAYEQAQRDAAAKNEAEVKRIETEQDRISSNVETDLRARLERLRSELRKPGASPSNPNGSKAGPDGKAPGGANEEAGVCLAPSDVLRAAENEERHDQLITWVEQQLGVKR